MPRSLMLSSVLWCATALVAQVTTGRTMHLLAPAVIGQTASYQVLSPASATGNFYAVLWCAPPFAGTSSITVPGINFLGTLRIDPPTSVAVATGLFGASGSSPHSFTIPNVGSLVGYAWDLQSADLAASTVTVAFSDNELALTVSGQVPSNMVPIAAGTFLMGSSSTLAAAHEQPTHQVTITRPFWIGMYEVTQAEWQALMGTNPSQFGGANRPVEKVSWTDAMAYCAVLTAQEAAAGRLPSGYEYRLPTEAEWEYCCRAGTTTEWNTGTSPTCGQANLWVGGFFCIGQTRSVGVYSPNPWGLHDMHGNVWEWCLDHWDSTANYPSGPVSDPYVTSGSDRARRGGGWNNNGNESRSARRGSFAPATQTHNQGFRVVLAPIL